MKIISRLTISPDQNITAEQIIENLLKQREINDLNAYLNPTKPWEQSITDFGYEKELKNALKILKKIKEKEETIVVYTDYDADGITGGTILWETLHLLGFKVMPFVPHRQHDGYGFSDKGIDKAIEQFNPKLVISVDHGIAAVEQVAYMKKKGIQVIITDHHTKQATVPKPDALFHIPELSGAGVAYFFAKAVFEHFDPDNKKLLQLFKTDYVSIASIGAVADLVPLLGPTRSLVKYGLPHFALTKRVGLVTMMEEAQVTGRALTPFDIGFIIAPRINAIGRLEHALDALRLLCTKNKTKALELTAKLATMNDSRKGLVDKAIREALLQVQNEIVDGKVPKLLIVRSDNWHEGIIGLIASKLVEKYTRPVIVLTKSEAFLKASARSVPSVNITELLTGWKEYFINYGGHHQAAGFSISEEKYEEFKRKVCDDCEILISDDALEPILYTDIEIPFSLLTMSLAEKIEALEPFGIGNHRPAFYSKGMLIDMKLMGKNKNHLKLWINDSAKRSIPIEFIAFSKGEDGKKLKKNKPLTFAYTLELNRWNGKTSLQGKLITFSQE